MGTPRSPWMAKIYDLLADGDWHDRETLVTAAMPLVPPGKAARTAAADRERMHAARRRQGVAVIPSQSRRHDDQAVGARTKVTHSLSGAIRAGHIEQHTVAGVIQIRLPREAAAPSLSDPARTRTTER